MPRGVRGLVVMCDDCNEDHYHDPGHAAPTCSSALADGTVRPHEPAVDPRPRITSRDYRRGYADGQAHCGRRHRH